MRARTVTVERSKTSHYVSRLLGTQRETFENTPNPRFLYPSKQHREGLRKLLYAITEEKGCALLTGEYGCGKTHLVRTVVKNLGANYEVAIINCPLFDGKEFLEEILLQFGRDGERVSRLECFRELSDFFYENVAENKTNILIIDSMIRMFMRNSDYFSISNWKIASC